MQAREFTIETQATLCGKKEPEGMDKFINKTNNEWREENVASTPEQTDKE